MINNETFRIPINISDKPFHVGDAVIILPTVTAVMIPCIRHIRFLETDQRRLCRKFIYLEVNPSYDNFNVYPNGPQDPDKSTRHGYGPRVGHVGEKKSWIITTYDPNTPLAEFTYDGLSLNFSKVSDPILRDYLEHIADSAKALQDKKDKNGDS